MLLISDEHFRGKQDALGKVTERLTKTNITHGRPENPPLFFAPDHPALIHTFNLNVPLRNALGALQPNAAQGIAELSGGTYLPLNNRGNLEKQLLALANDLNNRYLLSFEPSDQSLGLHSIMVTMKEQSHVHVTSRPAYWNTSTKP